MADHLCSGDGNDVLRYRAHSCDVVCSNGGYKHNKASCLLAVVLGAAAATACAAIPLCLFIIWAAQLLLLLFLIG